MDSAALSRFRELDQQEKGLMGLQGDPAKIAATAQPLKKKKEMKRFGGQRHHGNMGFRAPIPGPQRDKLEQLRLTLERLDRTGDLTSPSVAALRRIILDRIAELEAATPSSEKP